MFSLATVNEAIADAVPDREAIVFRNRRITYRMLTDRTRRLANYLLSRGLRCHTPRADMADWESGQDTLALYLYNGNEYLEGMLAGYRARVAPFNVNYRYVEEELLYLLNNAGTKAIIYHSEFAPRLQSIRARVPTLEVLIQVEDESGNALLPGAVEYEATLAGASSAPPAAECSPDDLYILYTGGTTGMPKGVLWRQADILAAALGGRDAATGKIIDSLGAYQERAKLGGTRMLPAAPFMHGAGHWIAFTALHAGHTVIVQDEVRRLDAPGLLEIIEREHVGFLQIVGDAFARPLLDAMATGPHDLSGLASILSGGAPLNAALKAEFLAHLPHLVLIDGLGSSEAGGQGSLITTASTGASTGRFLPGPDNAILAEDLSAPLAPGHEGIGWWAKTGPIPLGYLGDEEKTKKTFVTVQGIRYSVPGDRARLLADGAIELHGRDSVTINSGGEKIFAEEVEHAIKHHPGVYDAVVAGRPSERWGQEVVAIVRIRDGHAVSEQVLLEECARHIARYKHPKQFIFVTDIQRSPSGKADYRWAKEQALAASAAQ